MMPVKNQHIELIDTKVRNIIFIIISFALSWLIALSADIHQLQLGVLGHFFFPPIAAIITVLVYLLGNIVLKRGQMLLLVSCCIINLITGFVFYCFGT